MSRKFENSSLVLKEEEKRNQPFPKTPPEPLLTGNLVQNPECENTSRKVENPSLVLKEEEQRNQQFAKAATEPLLAGNLVQNPECEDTSRKVENSNLVLKEEEKRNQQFATPPSESLLAVNLGQDLECQGTPNKVESSTGLVKKKEDPTVLDLKEKGKKIQERDKNQPKLSLERQSVEKTLKTEKDASKLGTKNYSNKPIRRETPSPIYHITWDGFEHLTEELRQKCCLCEIDLADKPLDQEEEEFYDEIELEYCEEFSILPEVAVLPCGHAFHGNCLSFITTEDKSRDPPCCFCAN